MVNIVAQHTLEGLIAATGLSYSALVCGSWIIWWLLKLNKKQSESLKELQKFTIKEIESLKTKDNDLEKKIDYGIAIQNKELAIVKTEIKNLKELTKEQHHDVNKWIESLRDDIKNHIL